MEKGGIHVFILADDIFENFGVNLGVVPLLLQRHAIHLPRLYTVWDVIRIDLRCDINAGD
jgi:hypothetical protein